MISPTLLYLKISLTVIISILIGLALICRLLWASLVAQTVKNLLAMWETWVWSLGWEDPLKKGVATYPSILAWRIPRTEESGELQSMGLQRVFGSYEYFNNNNSFNSWLQCPSFHYLCIIFISFINVIVFKVDYSPPWLNIFLGILFFLM